MRGIDLKYISINAARLGGYYANDFVKQAEGFLSYGSNTAIDTDTFMNFLSQKGAFAFNCDVRIFKHTLAFASSPVIPNAQTGVGDIQLSGATIIASGTEATENRQVIIITSIVSITGNGGYGIPNSIFIYNDNQSVGKGWSRLGATTQSTSQPSDLQIDEMGGGKGES